MNNRRLLVRREQSDLNIISVEIQSDSWDIEWNNEPSSSLFKNNLAIFAISIDSSMVVTLTGRVTPPNTFWEICREYSQILCHINQLDALKNNIKSNYFWDGIFCLVSNRNFFQQIPQLWIIEDDWRSEDAIKRRSQLTPCAIKCFQWENFWKFEWWRCWGEDVTSSPDCYHHTLYLRNCHPVRAN